VAVCARAPRVSGRGWGHEDADAAAESEREPPVSRRRPAAVGWWARQKRRRRCPSECFFFKFLLRQSDHKIHEASTLLWHTWYSVKNSYKNVYK
jgi:hypothetical protein